MFGFKVMLALVWGALMGVITLLAAITVVGLPITPLLLWAACYPLYRTINNAISAHVAYDFRERALENDESPPWDEEMM